MLIIEQNLRTFNTEKINIGDVIRVKGEKKETILMVSYCTCTTLHGHNTTADLRHCCIEENIQDVVELERIYENK